MNAQPRGGRRGVRRPSIMRALWALCFGLAAISCLRVLGDWGVPWLEADFGYAVYDGVAAAGTVLCVVLLHRCLVALGVAEHEAQTDALTGLGNRRALLVDLDAAVASGQHAMLVLLDLDGFQRYNDAFGHAAGEALRQRLAANLRDAVGAVGTAYRMGGDEFSVLLGPYADQRVVSAARAALSVRGEGFAIFASHGRVDLPAEATDTGEALRTADRRVHHDKPAVPLPAAEQTTQALLRVLSERHADMGDHSEGVADLAEAVARRLGLGDKGAREVRAGAELHDIGKAAIPDAILSKPGPLDPDERAFMRRHTLIGERIVASADALAGVAKLVRSSHERWDAGGYPDGLAGEDIPLGARIIAVCDAFDAMLADRPYSAALEFNDALAELDRCAGKQFDPHVVEAFAAIARERATNPLDRPRNDSVEFTRPPRRS